MLFNENAKRLDWLITIPTLIMIVTQDYNWLMAYLLFGVLMLVYRHDSQAKPELEIERFVKGKNFKEGDRIAVKLIISNVSDHKFQGEIVDILPNHSSVWEGSNINLMEIAPHTTKEMIYKVLFSRRGKYLIGPVKVRHHSDSLIQEERFEVESLKEVVIVPQPEKVTTYSLPPSFLTSIGGLFRSKLVGDGFDFSGVREYRFGDPMRRVNWKSSAKYNKLYSNEFEINRASNLIMVLDLTEESIEIADASVRAALGLAEFLMNNRTKVGIITLGKYINYIPPKTGKRHLLEITEHLTDVDTVTSIRELALFKSRLEETIERVGKRSNDIILFSSLNRPENVDVLTDKLPKLGNLTILAPTAVYMSGKRNEFMVLSERILNLRKQVMRMYLGEMGIKIYEWTPELPFDTSISSWRYQ